jgi:hypothetical protein
MLREGKFSSPDAKTELTDFYENYFLSRWTEQEGLKNLAKYRGELAGHCRAAKPGETRDHLTRTVLDFLKKLVDGDYHPAVRINAMLAIGDLNRVERSGRDEAVPLPEALDVLVAYVENKKLPESLRATAMIGILRHAAAGIQGSDPQKKVGDLALRLATANLPNSALAGRAWMVAQGAETLGALGAVGDNNEVFTALLKLVADTKLPLLVRCAAADAIGRLNYSSANGINPVDAATALGRLAADVCKDGLAATKDTAGKTFRRRMLHRLIPVATALAGDDDKNHKGIASLAKDPEQKLAGDVQKALKEAVEELDNSRNTGDLKEIITKLQQSLNKLLPKKS